MSKWTRDALQKRVYEILRDELLAGSPGLTPQSDLLEAGLESLTVTQLMLSIEEMTGVWIDESLLTPENLATAETLANCVYEQLERA